MSHPWKTGEKQAESRGIWVNCLAPLRFNAEQSISARYILRGSDSVCAYIYTHTIIHTYILTYIRRQITERHTRMGMWSLQVPSGSTAVTEQVLINANSPGYKQKSRCTASKSSHWIWPRQTKTDFSEAELDSFKLLPITYQSCINVEVLQARRTQERDKYRVRPR